MEPSRRAFQMDQGIMQISREIHWTYVKKFQKGACVDYAPACFFILHRCPVSQRLNRQHFSQFLSHSWSFIIIIN